MFHFRRYFTPVAAVVLVLGGCAQPAPVHWQALQSQPSRSVDVAARACVAEVEEQLLSMGPAESPVFIFGTTTSEAGLWARVREQELFDECMAAQGWQRSSVPG